jgi:hypothetical protein
MLLIGSVHGYLQSVGRYVYEGCVFTICDRASTPCGVVRVLYAAMTEKPVSAEKKLSGRKSYDSGGEVKFARERYNRVEEIPNVTREGNKNICVMDKKPADSAICSKKKGHTLSSTTVN